MVLTAQFEAQTPRPTEATTVEKRTRVATNAFKFGPSQFGLKYAVYMHLGSQPQSSPRRLLTVPALTLVTVDR
jgi:hypothetical protein